MKSIALKTNNSQVLEYLLKEISSFDLDNIYFSYKEFRHYKNIIIHYKGTDNEIFINKLSTLLSFFVIYEFEETFLKDIIFKNYFYFSRSEREIILNNCFDIMVDSTKYLKNKFNVLFSLFKKYLLNNRNVFLSGFIDFRLNKYYDILNSIVDEAVNGFIIEKEYKEFISLMRVYINSQKNNSAIVHIIYSNNFTIMLDENKNVIETSKDIFNTKFLSDISFSTNDYILNTLLELLPSKIYIHLIDNVANEFINTLNLIFEDRITICTDCDICNLYKKISTVPGLTDK